MFRTAMFLIGTLLILTGTAQAETVTLQLQPGKEQVILWRSEGDRERGLALEAVGQYEIRFNYHRCMVFRDDIRKGMRAHVLWRRAGLVRVLLLDRSHVNCEGVIEDVEARRLEGR